MAVLKTSNVARGLHESAWRAALARGPEVAKAWSKQYKQQLQRPGLTKTPLNSFHTIELECMPLLSVYLLVGKVTKSEPGTVGSGQTA